jgi:hypothetical protein
MTPNVSRFLIVLGHPNTICRGIKAIPGSGLKRKLVTENQYKIACHRISKRVHRGVLTVY